MVAGGGHRHGGAAAERGEGKGEKRRWSTAHPRSTARGWTGSTAVRRSKRRRRRGRRRFRRAEKAGRRSSATEEREGDGASSIPAGRRCGKGRKRAREARGGRDESAISDLVGHGFEEEDYPVVDYESDLQTAMSTTVR
uniref:Transposon protein, putative, unclassified n=1 Tax=Oryza sativa subsp. japonica TaxID=39947 RepID=Q53PS9_ORYSJ|nr:transposon protein, putative, unclassified [Oryza sativa Japonica Group]